ncbi:MAG: hypothetical protein LBO63_02575 [Oscillospiraceae bacterium]|nr:hypothetical protein [Oscillospiraceae bacterium]
MFVIAAKLRLAALLSACAAGGSFLVLARKEPKKPLLGLGGLQSYKCTCPYVRIQTELPTDGLAPYVQAVGVGGWQPKFGEANPHRALRCAVRQVVACHDAQSAEVDKGTRPHIHSRVQWYDASVCGKPNKGRRGRRPLRRLLW